MDRQTPVKTLPYPNLAGGNKISIPVGCVRGSTTRCQYQWGRDGAGEEFPCLMICRGGGASGVPCLLSMTGVGAALYSEVQCIMGNDHMAPLSCEQTDRHKWKHYFPTISLADGNNNFIWGKCFHVLLVSAYVICERLSVMHKQVSVWTVNLCPNSP